MTAPKGRRWVCPLCAAGAIAPQRPRRDDVRRYCLDCSAATGRLVERTCPAADREREEREARRVARTQRTKERDRDTAVAKRTVGGVDLLAEARRFWKLPAIREQRGKRVEFPTIEIRRRELPHSSGHCWYGRHPRITVTAGSDPQRAIETMLHEIVHAACLGNAGHGPVFWNTLRRAAREAWPTARFNFADNRDGWQTDRAAARGIPIGVPS